MYSTGILNINNFIELLCYFQNVEYMQLSEITNLFPSPE